MNAKPQEKDTHVLKYLLDGNEFKIDGSVALSYGQHVLSVVLQNGDEKDTHWFTVTREGTLFVTEHSEAQHTFLQALCVLCMARLWAFFLTSFL